MSAMVYQEPNKLPAGMLALAVHIAFFALLYFGFSWQTKMPEIMSVELWQSLPDVAPAPPVEAKVEEVIPPTPKPEVIKPDIVIPDKKPVKKVEVKPEIKPEIKPPEKTKVKPEAKKPSETKKAMVQPAQPSAAEQQAARDQAAQEAATGRVVDEYISKIRSKIRSNIVMPPDVANDARAEFLVTLLPGGRVMNARLAKSSGNAAYDNAVERAILKSDPLPLPADTGLFNRFRELKLGFKPTE
jgi:colicin import membrane protein